MNNDTVKAHLQQLKAITGRDDLVQPVIDYIEEMEDLVAAVETDPDEESE